MVYMEHVNLTVRVLEDAIAFLQTAFPEFKVRGGGEGVSGPWVHIGTDTCYMALTQGNSKSEREPYTDLGYNHVGFVVQTVAALAEQLLAAGYERSYPKQIDRFRIREYFVDKEGNEYEFVQYLSEVRAEQNDYSI